MEVFVSTLFAALGEAFACEPMMYVMGIYALAFCLVIFHKIAHP